MMFAMPLENGLKLTMLEKRHAPAFYELLEKNRDYFAEFLAFPHTMHSVSEAGELIQKYLDFYAKNLGWFNGIWDGKQLIGVILVKDIQESIGSAEIGYFIDQRYQGKGIITNLTKKMIGYLFEDMGMNKIVINCGIMNYRSQAIPKKLGFKQDGIIRQNYKIADRLDDTVQFSLLRSEYLQKMP